MRGNLTSRVINYTARFQQQIELYLARSLPTAYLAAMRVGLMEGS